MLTGINRIALLAAFAALMVLPSRAGAEEEGLRLLFLTKSGSFEHSVIKQDESGQSHAGKVMAGIAQDMNASLIETKDASLVNAKNLQNFDVVIFYTQGRLTEPGLDEKPPMKKEGIGELLSWIEAGGGFVGIHSATDTFKIMEDFQDTAYIGMIGGQFAGHGQQFTASLRVVDEDHPTMQRIPQGFTHPDEWYMFDHWNKDDLHVLALLEIGDERKNQEMYDVPDYPIIWCRTMGDGRIYSNAMGHREDVWTNETFQEGLADAIQWAAGQGKADAEPNFRDVTPGEGASKEGS